MIGSQLIFLFEHTNVLYAYVKIFTVADRAPMPKTLSVEIYVTGWKAKLLWYNTIESHEVAKLIKPISKYPYLSNRQLMHSIHCACECSHGILCGILTSRKTWQHASSFHKERLHHKDAEITGKFHPLLNSYKKTTSAFCIML